VNGTAAILLVNLLLSALLVAACGRSSGTEPPTGPTFTVMQMNLCLSGLAGCYDPAAVEEAVSRIRRERPDAVTLNETCRRDLARIARATGYHLRFTRVLYAGERLRCVRPRGRGLFGDAVLTEAPIESAESRDFEAQAGPERRRWLCVTTRAEVDVCTAHLNTRSAVEVEGNDGQCAELAALLAGAASAAVVFGGDVNRRRPCAPRGAWTRTDASASQAPGLQHVYGARALRSPSAEVIPAEHSDHDFLLVRARR
jgi:endonuclease/exonuclease/phosphatase family metal-dependent hydrolase